MLQQNYSNYTAEDHKVWSILFDRQTRLLKQSADPSFLNGLHLAGFTGNAVPDFSITNQHLAQLTGWKVEAAEGIVDDSTFFRMLSKKRFPATYWIRSMSQLDYLEEPDMFHDVYGHIPLLTDESYGNFLVGLSNIGLKYIDNPAAIELLSRVYWYTIEFGLITTDAGTKVYGAGLISSLGETPYSLSAEVPKLRFDVEAILETGYIKSEFQKQYFVIDSFEQLYNSLHKIDLALKELVNVTA